MMGVLDRRHLEPRRTSTGMTLVISVVLPAPLRAGEPDDARRRGRRFWTWISGAAIGLMIKTASLFCDPCP